MSLGLVTMAETIQNVVLCFPGETGSSRIFDDKPIQALDKRRRSKQRGLDTKGAPVLPILPNPTTNPTPPPPNATNLFPLKDLAAPGRRRRRVRQENQVTRVAASLPPSPQPVSCNNSISPFRPPSPSGTMQQIAMSRRSTPRGRQSLSPFARKHPWALPRLFPIP